MEDFVWTRTLCVGVPVMGVPLYTDMASTCRPLVLLSHLVAYTFAQVYRRGGMSSCRVDDARV